MNKTHTPAPWAWQLFGDTYMLAAQHGRREIIIGAIEAPEWKYPVPAMTDNGLLKVVDNTHPNAKLIAAAPELLEALRDAKNALNEIIKALPEGDNNEYDPGQMVMDIEQAIRGRYGKIEAAIEKATP